MLTEIRQRCAESQESSLSFLKCSAAPVPAMDTALPLMRNALEHAMALIDTVGPSEGDPFHVVQQLELVADLLRQQGSASMREAADLLSHSLVVPRHQQTELWRYGLLMTLQRLAGQLPADDASTETVNLAVRHPSSNTEMAHTAAIGIERGLTRAFMAGSEGMLLASPDGRIHHANHTAEHLLGWAPGALNGVSLWSLMAADVQARWQPASVDAQAAGAAHPPVARNAVMPLKRADGAVLMAYGVVQHLPPHGHEPGMVFASFHDHTEAIAQLEDLRRAALRAEAAQRAGQGALSQVSHELRTPLHAVLAFASLVENQVTDARQREHVAQILRAGRHMLALANDLLDVARLESGHLPIKLQPVNVAQQVSQCFQMLGPMAEGHPLLMHVPDTVNVVADGIRLKQVLLNLLSNALRHNRAPGHIEVHAWQTGGRCRIAVSDTGTGLPEGAQDRLFQPFARLNNSHDQGTGLGLHISRELVQRMGGEIGVNSVPGEGCCFWVDLPMPTPLHA